MIINNIPIFCFVTKKKKFWFNLNNYRNAHFRVLDKTKKWFTEWFFSQKIKVKKFKKPVEIKYYVSPKKRSDLMNVGSVVDKFMEDALVKRGILEDDNCQWVKKVSFEFMGYSKYGNVDMEIKEID